MDRPYGFSGFLYRSNGAKEAITITVGVPEEAPDQSYFCEIRTRLLPTDPYRVYYRLKHDAWAKAFELLHNALKHTDGVLLNGKGEQVELPSPPRDRSWVGPPTVPNIERVEPIYRIEGRLAKDISVPALRIYEIVKGQRAITANTVLRLSRYFGLSERFWMNLQTRYDLESERWQSPTKRGYFCGRVG